MPDCGPSPATGAAPALVLSRPLKNIILFGAIEIGNRTFFKIDYYDRSLTFHSADAADPAVTTRVLTVMRADEH